MLSVTTVLEIRRLLNEGDLSQHEIADLMQVSRSTVAAISDGRRGLVGRWEELKALASAKAEPPAGPDPVRCPGCGGLVYLPCRLCRLRGRGRGGHPPRRVA